MIPGMKFFRDFRVRSIGWVQLPGGRSNFACVYFEGPLSDENYEITLLTKVFFQAVNIVTLCLLWF